MEEGNWNYNREKSRFCTSKKKVESNQQMEKHSNISELTSEEGELVMQTKELKLKYLGDIGMPILTAVLSKHPRSGSNSSVH